MCKEKYIFTIGDLKSWLNGIPDGDELIFQGNLTFIRVKERGANLQHMEFEEGHELYEMSEKIKKNNSSHS